jgi:hypothetical protein
MLYDGKFSYQNIEQGNMTSMLSAFFRMPKMDVSVQKSMGRRKEIAKHKDVLHKISIVET